MCRLCSIVLALLILAGTVSLCIFRFGKKGGAK